VAGVSTFGAFRIPLLGLCFFAFCWVLLPVVCLVASCWILLPNVIVVALPALYVFDLWASFCVTVVASSAAWIPAATSAA
jgi:hypothetical protein